LDQRLKTSSIDRDSFFWVLEVLCALHRKPYAADMAAQQIVPPYTKQVLYQAMEGYGYVLTQRRMKMTKLRNAAFPLLVWLREAPEHAEKKDAVRDGGIPAFVIEADREKVLVLYMGNSAPVVCTHTAFALLYDGNAMHLQQVLPEHIDQGELIRQPRRFGFAWFTPELIKHRQLWREIMLASLVIQLIALATPLFTQTIIDKVIVNRTQSTLIAIAFGMAVFMLFSALLTWLRQYLVLHTGNRVDAVLGANVFNHLLKLPLLYFQHRPTGVISARLHGIETIREFISSAAITLLLDLPFLLIFVAVMFYYSVILTSIVLAILVLIVGLSLISAPLFQKKLQDQFAKGARNQAFVTEYVAAMETVKSLQLEPQLGARFNQNFAAYLQSSFSAKQLGNSYNTLANLLEQLMSLLILGVGAYTVMHSVEFTIGMLVAFQMFAGKLSQPLLRLVGLWQQFQQAKLSVERLGDLMNAPAEPYSMAPHRHTEKSGHIVIDQISFRYDSTQPYLYQGLSLEILPGQLVAIMGASGSGKSTLTKLLQGFYQPETGKVYIDGIAISHLSANELRSYFGVVPQETSLFSGTLYENLQLANPHASFEQIVAVCKMAEIHTVIEALPKAYQTEIGERGAGLSGGQKQRIAIARALLKSPAILIFDEATSALDQTTAQQFAETINRLKGRVTMMFITHGLPSKLNLDVVYQLSTTGIVPQGSLSGVHPDKREA
jgi:subfamily B ATP-binding cassette protein HlyB/CyaB